MRKRRDDAKRKPLRKTENNCCDLTMLEFKLKEFLACTTTLVPHVIPAHGKRSCAEIVASGGAKEECRGGGEERKTGARHDSSLYTFCSAAALLQAATTDAHRRIANGACIHTKERKVHTPDVEVVSRHVFFFKSYFEN